MRNRLLWIVLGVIVAVAAIFLKLRPQGDSFGRLMSLGAGYLQKGDATNAIATYSRAVSLAPENTDARLNLANAYLLAGSTEGTIGQSQEVLRLDHNNAAAYYLLGCAYLRSNQAEPAVQAFQQSQKIDPAVTALNFQLGLAQEKLGHLEDAIQQFETAVQFEPGHPSAHYQLSRLYQRVGRNAEAAQELAKHEQIRAKNPAPASDPTAFERCKYTQPKVAVALAQPERRGVPVHFVDVSSTAFGQQAALYHGPIGVLDYNHDGRNSLFAMEGTGFRLLNNTNGQFRPLGDIVTAPSSNTYTRCLVGDLNNDRFEDVLILGEQASHLFRFATNGQFRQITQAAGLNELKARDGLLADLDFTGKLDLLAIAPGGEGLRVWRNLGNAYFREDTTNTGLPLSLGSIANIAVEDLNNEDAPGVVVSFKNRSPIFFSKKRAGSFVETNLTANWPTGSVMAFGDLNNDLLPDFILADDQIIYIGLSGAKELMKLPVHDLHPKGLLLLDYDNDGWLDLLAYGNGIQLWRNEGKAGFKDVTASVGLNHVGLVESVHAADFDADGDTDLLLVSSKGLALWRNDGGNANKQLKLHLVGNRSNASALGARVEVTAGNWRAIRTLNQLPFELGIGKHDKIDVLKVRWFDLDTTVVDLSWQPQPLTVAELTLPSGSCPYLYAWDGHGFKFVTDILGASPLGLPVSATHFVDADPEEFLALGTEEQFPSRDGKYELRITEELREVLYLDQARLMVVDHPTGTVVHATSKMLPGPPFLPHELWNLRPRASLKQAIRSDGLDVTEALATTDSVMVSPVRLREPQLRGLAEPFSITFDFGPLPEKRPLVLVMNGWLRFGGGMANIAASLDSTLPFPFPKLEAELADKSWKPIAVDVGVPAGKTKTILIDLEDKLPPGSRRIRWTSAFEIYWDYVSLCEKASKGQGTSVFSAGHIVATDPAGTGKSAQDCVVRTLEPSTADLRWRGFSQFARLPDSLPLTPEYNNVQASPPWRRTPSGWCTRYGSVKELVREPDNAPVMLNGGDELALAFSADKLPAKHAGFVRNFFLYVVGWDKDADFHVAQGWRIEPLPFLGMDSQHYGLQAQRDEKNNWAAKYNTRWVGPLVLGQGGN